MCNLTGWVKCLRVGKIIYQLGKIFCHLIGFAGGFLLHLVPNLVPGIPFEAYLLGFILNLSQGWIMATVTQRITGNMRTDIEKKTGRMPLK